MSDIESTIKLSFAFEEMRNGTKNLKEKGSPTGKFKYQLRHGPISPASIMNNENNLKLFETLAKDVKGLKIAKRALKLGQTLDAGIKEQNLQTF